MTVTVIINHWVSSSSARAEIIARAINEMIPRVRGILTGTERGYFILKFLPMALRALFSIFRPIF